MAQDDLVQMIYVGTRVGGFRIVAQPSRREYHVPGAGAFVEMGQTGRQGVFQQDVPWFRSVNQGRDFRFVEQPAAPKPAPKPEPKPEPVPEAGPDTSEAWTPDLMESAPLEPMVEELELPDLSEMTVREIIAYDWPIDKAESLLAEERAGNNRKTVINLFEAALRMPEDLAGGQG